MPAEHLSDRPNDTDEMYRDGCRVVLTSDSAGIPVIRISTEVNRHVLIYFHDEVVLDATPDLETRAVLEAAKQAERDARSDKDKVLEAVIARQVAGDAADPMDIAIEEAAKLGAERAPGPPEGSDRLTPT